MSTITSSFAKSIAAALREESDMETVAQAAKGMEALAAYKWSKPDVTLMDLQMPKHGWFYRYQALPAKPVIRRLERVMCTAEGPSICSLLCEGKLFTISPVFGSGLILLLEAALQQELAKSAYALHTPKRAGFCLEKQVSIRC